VPKKCRRCHPLPKKPEVPPPATPEAVALAEELGLDGKDVAMKDAPSTAADPFISLTPPSLTHRTHPSHDEWVVYFTLHPFPREFDRSRIVSWVAAADRFGADREVQLAVAMEAGHHFETLFPMILPPHLAATLC
jgi:hypothetical protein